VVLPAHSCALWHREIFSTAQTDTVQSRFVDFSRLHEESTRRWENNESVAAPRTLPRPRRVFGMFTPPTTRERASTVARSALVLSLLALANAAETRHAATLAAATLASPRLSSPLRTSVATRTDATASVGAREARASTATRTVGLEPCGGTDPECFVLRTPFPAGDVTASSCALLAVPSVTLDGEGVRVRRHAFDGADLTFFVDVRAALRGVDARPGDTPSLRASAKLTCPKRTFEAAAATATASDAANGRVSWIFPFNFFLVEELAILGDSIEALVEASDDLQITVTGDDGSAEFLYAGFEANEPFALSGDTRDESANPFAAFAGTVSGALQSAQNAASSAFDALAQTTPPDFCA
jgi:hypothetical protein